MVLRQLAAVGLDEIGFDFFEHGLPLGKPRVGEIAAHRGVLNLAAAPDLERGMHHPHEAGPHAGPANRYERGDFQLFALGPQLVADHRTERGVHDGGIGNV